MVMQAKPLLWQTLSLTDRKINYKLTHINDSALKLLLPCPACR